MVARDRIVPPHPGNTQVLEAELEPGGVYPGVDIKFKALESLNANAPAGVRAAVVIRDLRDTLVSLYFSLKHSHPPMFIPRFDLMREQIRTFSKEEGLRTLMQISAPSIAALQMSWVGSGVPVFRYEDLVTEGQPVFERFLQALGLEVPSGPLRSILQACSFESRTGRKLGEVDEKSHMRSGKPGGWAAHLHGSLLAEFKDKFDDVLIETGYENTRDWGATAKFTRVPAWERVSRRPSISRPCWCGGSPEPWGAGYGLCPDCGTLCGTADVEVEDLPDLYGRDYFSEPSFDHRRFGRVGSWRGSPADRAGFDLQSTDVIARLSAALSVTVEGARVLDLSAGSGALVALLNLANRNAMGLESSEEMAAAARDGMDVNVIAGRVPPSGAWEAIVAPGTLGHDPEPLELLQASAKALAPGGCIILHEPEAPDGDYAGARAEGYLLTNLDPVERPWLFTSFALNRLIRAAGLVVVGLEPVTGTDNDMLNGLEPVIVCRIDESPAEGGRTTKTANLLFDLQDLLGAANKRRVEAGVIARARIRTLTATGRLVEDLIGFGPGFHELEQHEGEVFRWASTECGLRVAQASGRHRRLRLQVEPGPATGSASFTLQARDDNGALLGRVLVPVGRTVVNIECLLQPGAERCVWLRAVPKAVPQRAPGDSRELAFRVFAVGWE